MPRPMAIKNRSKLSFRKRQHHFLRFSVLAIGLVSLGAVVGKVSEHPFGTPDDPLSPSSQLGASVLPPPVISLTPDVAQDDSSPVPTAESVQTEAQPQTTPDGAQTGVSPEPKTVSVVIEKGSNLSRIFTALSLPSSELDQILDLGSDAKSLARLRAGESINFQLSDTQDGNPQLQRLSYDLGMERTLHIVRTDDGMFKSEIEQHPLEYRQSHGQGVIHDSFYNAATEAGLPPNIVMQLADIFGWKINFLTDIQDGDRFSILYESVHKDGKQLMYVDVISE